MKNRAALAAAFLVAFWAPVQGGCIGPAPATSEREWDEGCEGTQAGNGCLTLRVTVKDSVRKSSPDVLTGNIRWAIYKGGDVSAVGPGNHPKILNGERPESDFTAPDSAYEIPIPDLASQQYQVLGHLDHDLDYKDDAGELVTFPKDPFRLPGDRHIVSDLVFDYVHP